MLDVRGTVQENSLLCVDVFSVPALDLGACLPVNCFSFSRKYRAHGEKVQIICVFSCLLFFRKKT